MAGSGGGVSAMWLLSQANELTQELNTAPQTPTLALPAAAAIIARRLGAAHCSICAITTTTGAPSADGGGAPGADAAEVPAAVLLAAHGAGAGALAAWPVMRGGGDEGGGSGWSALRVAASGAALRADADADAGDEAGALPRDWAALRAEAGLRGFLAVPARAGGRVQGALCVAAPAGAAFAAEWAEAVLAAAANALLPHLRAPQLRYLSALLAHLDAAAPDPARLVARLLHGAREYVHAATNTRVGARLGLADAARREALLLELDARFGGAGGGGGVSGESGERFF